MPYCVHKFNGKKVHKSAPWDQTLRIYKPSGPTIDTCSKCGLSEPMYKYLQSMEKGSPNVETS